jgi:transmembrane 9 superfamily protein 2/4
VFVVSGAVGFACYVAPLTYMWQSIWRSEVVYMYGWVLIFSVMLIAVISELSIIYTFATLRSGDPRWQWRAFLVGASSAGYFGVYALIYMAMNLNMKLLDNDLVYLLWTILFVVSTAMLTGTVSTFASTAFVNNVYNWI